MPLGHHQKEKEETDRASISLLLRMRYPDSALFLPLVSKDALSRLSAHVARGAGGIATVCPEKGEVAGEPVPMERE